MWDDAQALDNDLDQAANPRKQEIAADTNR
jgi:hypothetical protein